MNHRALPVMLGFLVLLISTGSLAAAVPPAPPRRPPPSPFEGPTSGPYAQPPPGSPAAPSASTPVAVPVAAERPTRGGRSHEKWVDTELRFSGGLAYPRGVSGAGYGRAELGIRMTNKEGLQLNLAVIGAEGWHGTGGTGASIPISAQVGYRLSALYAGVGVGLNAITFEQVRDMNAVGALSPLATGNAGFFVGPVGLLADVRAEYRWQLGNDNRALYTAGLTLVYTFPD